MVPVVDIDGNELYNVPRESAIDCIMSGRAHSVKGRAIRMLDQASAFGSHPSSCALGVHDVNVLIGATGCVSRKQSERLEGWGFKVSPKSENPLAGGLR